MLRLLACGMSSGSSLRRNKRRPSDADVAPSHHTHSHTIHTHWHGILVEHHVVGEAGVVHELDALARLDGHVGGLESQGAWDGWELGLGRCVIRSVGPAPYPMRASRQLALQAVVWSKRQAYVTIAPAPPKHNARAHSPESAPAFTVTSAWADRVRARELTATPANWATLLGVTAWALTTGRAAWAGRATAPAFRLTLFIICMVSFVFGVLRRD